MLVGLAGGLAERDEKSGCERKFVGWLGRTWREREMKLRTEDDSFEHRVEINFYLNLFLNYEAHKLSDCFLKFVLAIFLANSCC